MTRDMAYRGELDGVRAIAVLAVVLFHVGFPDMTGGYVGVDVFFVLSGYLICGQTYLRLLAGSYSVPEFFARRIRRLSSACALCFVVTALAACWGQTTPETFCRIGAQDGGPAFVLWGDSMANSALPAFDAYGAGRGQAGLVATAPGCAPLDGAGFNRECLAFNAAILAWLDRAPPMDVFVMARWSFYAEGYGNFGDAPGRKPLLRADGSVAPDTFAAFAEALDATLERVSARHRVIVVNHLPDFAESVPKAMLRALRFGTDPPRLSRAEFERRSGRAAEVVAQLAAGHGALHVAPYERFCDGVLCRHQIDGEPLFVDNVHLAPRGNALLRDEVEAVLDRERGQ